MSLTRVYKYKVHSDEHGSFVDTKVLVWATLEKISSISAQPIMKEFIDVPDSKIIDGFYHE